MEIMNNPILRELPVEMELSVEKVDEETQTDDINLFETTEVVEVPVLIEVAQKMQQTSFIKVEESSQKISEKGESKVEMEELEDSIE